MAELVHTHFLDLVVEEDKAQVSEITKIEVGKTDYVVQYYFTLLSKGKKNRISVLSNMTVLREGG